jgi:phenylpropionate dioxygenase-like ring-hydroxylating dioxygenase large terminal subunit
VFLKNAWYVAAWAHELADGAPLGRTFLDKPVVLFRKDDGSLAAIGNRCPHRFAPLHLGSQVGDALQCPYHGLRFDASGACVHNPHGTGAVPAALRVPRYPVVESDGLIWIWMGDEALADPSAVRRFDCLDRTRWASGTAYLHGAANYELMVDNIMDLSHVEFLHPGLGTDAISRAAITMEQGPGSVSCIRRMTNEVLPLPLQTVYRTGDTPVNRTFSVHWQAPSNMLMTIDIEPADPDREPFGTGAHVLHLFTPETATTTHYFYAGCRSYDIDDHALTEGFMDTLKSAFMNEDKPIIEAQQQMMRQPDLMSLGPVLLPMDGAAMRARRLLAGLIEQERSAEHGRPERGVHAA